MTQTTDRLAEVLNCDREAAASCVSPRKAKAAILSGAHDESSTVQAFARHRITATQSLSTDLDKAQQRLAVVEAENVRLREAAQSVIDDKMSTYTARNGRRVGIQADDGEMCWIIHSDHIFALETALNPQPGKESGK